MKFAQTTTLVALLAIPFASPTLTYGQGHSLVGYDETCSPLAGCLDYSPSSSYTPGTPNLSDSSQPLDFSSPFSGGLGSSSDVAVLPGYIESPIPMNQFRLRFDGMFDFENPDRAEFFYAQCGCNGQGAPGPGRNGVFNDPNPALQPQLNGSVDAQIYSLYVESARTNNFSVFAELPFRSIQPDALRPGFQDTGDESGIGDLNFGLKYALINTPDDIFTFQFRIYTPTGNANEGLGTDHVTLEPGILYQRSMTDNLLLFSEFKTWIPIDGSEFNGADYSGVVLQYGLGAGYTVYNCGGVSVTPLLEFVGWSVLDGLVTQAGRQELVEINNANTTIVNLKAGVRMNIARRDCTTHTIYAGFAQALTNDAWYENMVRVDWGILF